MWRDPLDELIEDLEQVVKPAEGGECVALTHS